MDDQIFKNQYALERMIVKFPLELNLRRFDPSEKMISVKNFQSPILKKVTVQFNRLEKYTDLEINPWKKS